MATETVQYWRGSFRVYAHLSTKRIITSRKIVTKHTNQYIRIQKIMIAN